MDAVTNRKVRSPPALFLLSSGDENAGHAQRKQEPPSRRNPLTRRNVRFQIVQMARRVAIRLSWMDSTRFCASRSTTPATFSNQDVTFLKPCSTVAVQYLAAVSTASITFLTESSSMLSTQFTWTITTTINPAINPNYQICGSSSASMPPAQHCLLQFIQWKIFSHPAGLSLPLLTYTAISRLHMLTNSIDIKACKWEPRPCPNLIMYGRLNWASKCMEPAMAHGKLSGIRLCMTNHLNVHTRAPLLLYSPIPPFPITMAANYETKIATLLTRTHTQIWTSNPNKPFGTICLIELGQLAKDRNAGTWAPASQYPCPLCYQIKVLPDQGVCAAEEQWECISWRQQASQRSILPSTANAQFGSRISAGSWWRTDCSPTTPTTPWSRPSRPQLANFPTTKLAATTIDQWSPPFAPLLSRADNKKIFNRKGIFSQI